MRQRDCESCDPEGGPRSPLLLDESPMEAHEGIEPYKPVHNSVRSTTISIIKCFIGAASFELPGAIKNGGLAG
jgi:hypothetical protein